MVSANAIGGRADAPTPGARVPGPHEPLDMSVLSLSSEALIGFRQRHAEMDQPRIKDAGTEIAVRIGDRVVWDSPATPPGYFTVVDVRRERRITGHDGTDMTWGETGIHEWLIQDDDGGLEWQTFRQRPWRNHTEMGLDRAAAIPPRRLNEQAYLSTSDDLSGATFRPVTEARAEFLGFAADGFQLIESRNGGLSYVRDTGRTIYLSDVKAVVFDRFEMDTYAADVDGRPTILGRPGSPIGQMFARDDATTREVK